MCRVFIWEPNAPFKFYKGVILSSVFHHIVKHHAISSYEQHFKINCLVLGEGNLSRPFWLLGSILPWYCKVMTERDSWRTSERGVRYYHTALSHQLMDEINMLTGCLTDLDPRHQWCPLRLWRPAATWTQDTSEEPSSRNTAPTGNLRQKAQ